MCNNTVALIVSIGREFENYDLLEKTLKSTEFDVLLGIDHPFLKTYCTQNSVSHNITPIAWSDTKNATNIKTNKWDKPYNADAPQIAAEKAVQHGTHILKFGIGDYNLNKAAQTAGLQELETKTKRYRF